MPDPPWKISSKMRRDEPHQSAPVNATVSEAFFQMIDSLKLVVTVRVGFGGVTSPAAAWDGTRASARHGSAARPR